MTESTPARTPLPLEVDRVQSSRSAVGETRLRVSGHWLGPHAELQGEQGLLVVHVEGRRHRFAADADDDGQAGAEPGSWSASFTVPSWAEPRQEGQAALWLGSAVIPVPPLHGSAVFSPAVEDAPAQPREAGEARAQPHVADEARVQRRQGEEPPAQPPGPPAEKPRAKPRPPG